MNNARLKQEKKLFTLYRDHINSDNIKKLVEFLNTYIRNYERDNSMFRCVLMSTNPLKEIEEDEEEILRTYNTIVFEINKYTNNLQKFLHKKGIVARLFAYLGVIYENGLFGTIPNKEMAFKKYKQSAQFNCPYGTFRLAQCYEKGIGTLKNIKQALYFYRCSAKLGSIEALHTFGTILIQNNFTEEYSEEVGVVYLRLAAKKATKKYPFACFDYSRYVEHNLSINNGYFDISFCYESYLKGALLECPNCQYKVGEAFEKGDMGVEASLIDSIKWYRRAAIGGHSDAQLKIADYLLMKNEFYPEDFELALSYALKSAISENARAAKYVSIIYQKGIGVRKHKNLSKWWSMIYEIYFKTQKISSENHSFSIFDKIVKRKRPTEDIPMHPIYTSSVLKAM